MTDIQGFARLGENPKLKFLPAATASDVRPVAEVRMCLLNYRKRGEDEFEDRGFWVDATIWNEQAEIVARNFRQGDKVYLLGDLSSGHWIDRETRETRSRPELRVEWIFPDLRSLAGFRYKPRAPREGHADAHAEVGQAQAIRPEASPAPMPDPDIPFGDTLLPSAPTTNALPAQPDGKKNSAA